VRTWADLDEEDFVIQRWAARVLAFLRRRFDRPQLLPDSGVLAVTTYIAEVPGQPEKFWVASVFAEGINGGFGPIEPRAIAGWLIAAAHTVASRHGLTEQVAQPSAPRPPEPPTISTGKPAAYRQPMHPVRKR
jgi:hypothetical protein